MNAKLLGLFSGFPERRFPEEIAERLREVLTERESLVFVSAWPTDFAQNDSDAAGMHGMFAEWNMPFERFCVIDERTPSGEAGRLIRGASCIFLMGGHAVRQFQLIRDKGILEDIHSSTAVILGVSAGSSNMACRALDIWESHVPYDGLGLADITIKAHVGQGDHELLRTLQRISEEQDMAICAMADESAIFVRDGQVSFVGEIRWIERGEVSPLSRECFGEVWRMNDIEIRVIDAAHKADINIPNEAFSLYGRLIPMYDGEKWSYTSELFAEQSEMCFPDENYVFEQMQDCVFIGAYRQEQCVGLAVLQDHWAKYMYLYDLKVNSAVRGMHIGSRLLDKAKQVAAARGYRGVYTIGQDNNLAACLFYLNNGFHIGGLNCDGYRGTLQEGKRDVLFYTD